MKDSLLFFYNFVRHPKSTGAVFPSSRRLAEVMVEDAFTSRPSFRPEPSPDSVSAALKALATAERPIIVAGGGVVSSQAQTEVVELAEKLSIPVATSINAKGAIPDNHRTGSEPRVSRCPPKEYPQESETTNRNTGRDLRASCKQFS